jgi:hypothetical protein
MTHDKAGVITRPRPILARFATGSVLSIKVKMALEGKAESRQGKPGKGESYVSSGNSSMESSGFNSHPARISHPPEASLA